MHHITARNNLVRAVIALAGRNHNLAPRQLSFTGFSLPAG
jgi:hypothetical protein